MPKKLRCDACLRADPRRLSLPELKSCINTLLYGPEPICEPAQPELLSLVVPQEKQEHFAFLSGATTWRTLGRWLDPKTGQVLVEQNVQLDVQFRDNPREEIGTKLMQLLGEFNRREVKEALLYCRTVPVEETSL